MGGKRLPPYPSFIVLHGRCSDIEEPAFDIETKCDNESPDFIYHPVVL